MLLLFSTALLCMYACMYVCISFVCSSGGGRGALLFITSVFTLTGFPPHKGWYIWLKYCHDIITIRVHCCKCWCQVLAVFDEEKAAGNIPLLFMSNAVNLLAYFKHSRCFNICCIYEPLKILLHGVGCLDTIWHFMFKTFCIVQIRQHDVCECVREKEHVSVHACLHDVHPPEDKRTKCWQWW